MPLSVRLIGPDTFGTMAAEWHDCLRQSEAHPLFMSWPWLFSWWETWSDELELELFLVGVFNDKNQLVGIGPFYRKDFVAPVGIRVRRLHLVGNAWHVAATVRTEYCGLIVRKEYSNSACRAMLDFIGRFKWDEWVICDSLDSELEKIERTIENVGFKASKVVRSNDNGVKIDTTGSFSEWLDKLGKNTRLKVFNRRRYLQGLGKLEIFPHSQIDFDEFLKQLNSFHVIRWGRPAFDELAVKFHRRLSCRLGSIGGRAECSMLFFKDECVSVLYDLVVDGQRFNLQSGYIENFDRKVSLGYLHLGLAIEKTFSDSGVFCYDLLAGAGKNQFYKSHFHGEGVRFNTMQWVRNPLLRYIYGVQGALPNGLRRSINSWFRL